MSHAPSSAALPPNFESTFNSALDAYKKRTKQDLTSHPLLPKLRACNSPSDVLVVFREQIPMLDDFHNGDEIFTKCLVPIVNILYQIWAKLGEDAGREFSPARLIFAGIGVLFLAANDVDASQERLLALCNRIGSFFQRLEEYMELPLTAATTDIFIEIMTELLSVLAITTVEMKRGRMGKYVKKLMGKTEIEDSLERLDKLTQMKIQIAFAELLKLSRPTAKIPANRGSRIVITDVEIVGNIGQGFQDGVDEGAQYIRYSAQSVEGRTQVPQRTDQGVQILSGGMEDFGHNVQGTQEGVEGVDERVQDPHDMIRGVDDRVQGTHIDVGMQSVPRGVEDIENDSRGIQAKVEGIDDPKRRKDPHHTGAGNNVVLVHWLLSPNVTTLSEPSQVPRNFSSAPMPYPSPSRPWRARRSSNPSHGMMILPSLGYPSQGHNIEPFQASRDVEFRLRGARHSGVSLNEILNGVRISESTAYSLRDLALDSPGKFTLKIGWTGYRSYIYEVPLSTDSFGYVDLLSLCRRTGRAILHFMDLNEITPSGDRRVIIYRLENSSPGIWVPIMTAH